MSKGMSRFEVEKIMKDKIFKLDLKKGELVFVCGTPEITKGIVEMLSEVGSRMINDGVEIADVPLVAVPGDFHIETADEETMNELGWFRK